MRGRKLSMREVRKILQCRLSQQVSATNTAAIVRKSKGCIIETMRRFEASGLPWPLPESMSDTMLEEFLYPATPASIRCTKPMPDLAYIRQEMLRPHMTLQRLYEEYRQEHPKGLRRSSYFRYVNKNRTPDASMRQQHRGGYALYSDYSGDSLSYSDLSTGAKIKTQLFVCSWGASSYSYIEARHTQKKEEFAYCHVNGFYYFGVVSYALVPDNTKSAVTKADRYDPIINPLFGLLCDHYGIVVLPARVRKPKDKAVVESNVLHVQEFILARLRNRQFFSLEEINQALWEELEIYNNRPMKDHGNLSRRQRFEIEDLPYAKPLPKESFKITTVKDNVAVARDYHIQYDGHFYSVPHVLVGKRVQVRQALNLVEIYHDGIRVAAHALSMRGKKFSTIHEHMPKAHQYVAGWSSAFFIGEAEKIGPQMVRVVEILLKRPDQIEQGYRAARGVLSLTKAYSPERLEKSCERVLALNSVSIRNIKEILSQNIDKQELKVYRKSDTATIVIHKNLRDTQEFQVIAKTTTTGENVCI